MLTASAAALVYLACPVNGATDWTIYATLNEAEGTIIYEESPKFIRTYPATFSRNLVVATTPFKSTHTIDRKTLIWKFEKLDASKGFTAQCAITKAPDRAF